MTAKSVTPTVAPTPSGAPRKRSATGVAGLDDILNGGFPPNRMYLIKGDPGVGKTTLGLQYLLEGLRRGESGLYITLSETRQELEEVAASHGWDLSGLHVMDLNVIREHSDEEATNTFFHPSEVELNRMTSRIISEMNRVNPARMVFDSLSEMRMLSETPLRYRRQILEMKQTFQGRNTTVLFLDDRTEERHDLHIESIAHGVIHLYRTSPEYGVARRSLNVQKIRGSKYREGNHDFLLHTGGMEVFPRLVAAEHHQPFDREAVASGIRQLDALFGGGLDRGTSNMFMGPPGTGKSTLALKFMLAAAERGEKSLGFILDETLGTLLNRAGQLGMELKPHIDSGMIRFAQVNPAEIVPGELASMIRDAVEKDDIRVLVLDSINGYLNALSQERFLNLQLHEMLTYLNQLGVVTIMVLAQQGLVGAMKTTVDLTYLADTVVLLRFFEELGAVKQAISVIKKRSGNHERTIREIKVGPGGIVVGSPLTRMQGVLTGIPNILSPQTNGNGDGNDHSKPPTIMKHEL
ncbi:circadian clock protein KaiC [Roseimicrobium gellanilyticum]|uniref:non-specific serine/threonine protein kinase n=1 Tax=Roseimicrobium gellanilyticum TaxID=748857 RepID=A0A366HNA4_9BACT|nr:ATPase domain-containing protein [Roseimicrobium gellanilyticum]RBP44638.1 circadian clock protein KaiC [Roseimicrobium gellanilyticum]